MTDSSNTNVREIVYQFAQSAKHLTNADRSVLWVVDDRSHEVWAPIQLNDGSWQEVRLGVGQGYVGSVIQTRELLNIPFDLYDDATSVLTQQNDRKTGYRTCSLLLIPIHHPNREVTGVIQLVNKSRDGQFSPYNPIDWPQAPDCFKASFDNQDKKAIAELIIEIAGILKDIST